MLEGKEYRIIGMVFPFFAYNIDNISGYLDQAPLKKVTTLYSAIILSLQFDHKTIDWPQTEIKNIRNKKQKMKKQTRSTFGPHYIKLDFRPFFSSTNTHSSKNTDVTAGTDLVGPIHLPRTDTCVILLLHFEPSAILNLLFSIFGVLLQ